MIRVTSGVAKGKRLQLPANQKVTAVKEVVKLAIFSILGDKITEARCLDLYAGSGNMGIEALSRGAGFCDFVDKSKTAVEAIKKNLKNCKLEGLAKVSWDDSLRFLENSNNVYDVIFADPYYTESNNRYLIKLAIQRLSPSGLFFLLSSASKDLPNVPKELIGTVQLETRKYGKTLLIMLGK